MKELNIGDRLEYEDGRGATVVGKYPTSRRSWRLPYEVSLVSTMGYTLDWDERPGVIEERLWQIDQEYLESCNMRIVNG